MPYKPLLTLLSVLLLNTPDIHAQITVPNGGFEEVNQSAGSRTAIWKTEGGDYTCRADNLQPFRGKYALRLHSPAAGQYFFNQEFKFASAGLNKFKFKCAVKTKGLQGRVVLGARLFDAQDNLLPKMMFTLTEARDQDWTVVEGFFIAEREAVKIRVFGGLLGSGTAWFDEVAIEAMPKAAALPPSPEVAMYIHEYFDIIYGNSILTDKTFIANLKAQTMQLCGNGTDLDDCRYILQQFTTTKLGDKHSFFSTAREYREMMDHGVHQNTGETFQQMPAGHLRKDNIAYISVPTFISSDPKIIAQYADTLQSLIARFDQERPAGWIIDLSNNRGGNCFPMIAGVGPLIGNGVCEYSFSGDGAVRQIIYNNGWTGTAWVGGDRSLILMKEHPYQLKNPGKPVAVIYGSSTGSSGEVTAIAFIGLANARSFGQPTYGITTRVDNFELSDGAYLNLASGINADRNKNKFGGRINPDVATSDTASAIAAAAEWIAGR